MQVSDMVLLIGIHPNSTGYALGIRKGDIGTIIAPSNMGPPYHWEVSFAKTPGNPCHCDEPNLRKIDPPEAADGWKYCTWKPEEWKQKISKITPEEIKEWEA